MLGVDVCKEVSFARASVNYYPGTNQKLHISHAKQINAELGKGILNALMNPKTLVADINSGRLN